MKISWNWLSDYVDLSGLAIDEVSKAMTDAGLEVEGIETIGGELDVIKVGEILEIGPHPGADKLVLCQVRFGSEPDGEPLQIVCGATNMKAGDRVPVIPAGNKLPDGTKIKKSKVRGEVSNGMLCSSTELGLPGDGSGLMILDPTAPVGLSLADHLGLRDTVIEIAITPNRGDALSYLGVARDIAALFGRERRWPGALAGSDPLADGGFDASDRVSVELADTEGCPRYAAAVIESVAVVPSPGWMAARLEAIGLRSVNNLVDVTNYVMFETGQPLHVFDFDHLADVGGGKRSILVRRARAGEQLESIDHVMRSLNEDDVVITDGSRPVAVAGVMGGVDSEVSDATTNVLIECAHFNPKHVRRTARRLGLHSDSSYRFERTVDPNGVGRVIRRTAELILATQPDGAAPRVGRGVVDAYPQAIAPRRVDLRVARANQLLGVDLTAEAMRDLLTNIDLGVEIDGEILKIEAPTFRPDLEREVDLIEEVGRLYGFDNIAADMPARPMGFTHAERAAAADRDAALPQPIVSRDRLTLLERLRDSLADEGLNEVVNYSFVAAEGITALGFAVDDARSAPVPVANPLSESWGVMRTSLLAGLLDNARHNLAHQEPSIGLFELGPVFVADDAAPRNTGVREDATLSALLAGVRPTRWVDGRTEYDAYDLKRVLDHVAALLRVEVEVVNADGAVSWLHPGVGARILARGEAVGAFGQLHPKVAERFGIEEPIFGLELSLSSLLDLRPSPIQFQPIARFPAAARDVAILLPEGMPYSQVEAALGSFKNGLVESASLASVYSGDSIPAGKKSVAVSVVYRSQTGSLTDKKIDAVHNRLRDHLVDKLGADLR